MGLLDWLFNRGESSAAGTAKRARDGAQSVDSAIDRAITLVNPRLKLVAGYMQALHAPTARCVEFLHDSLLSVPPPIAAAVADWANEPVLRAGFADAGGVERLLVRAQNLRTFFEKSPGSETAYFVLGFTYNEKRVDGLAVQGSIAQETAISQRVVDFSVPRIRICGESERDVRHQLAEQSFEYLVAQALDSLAGARESRTELLESRNLLKARLRLLQQPAAATGFMSEEAPDESAKRQLEQELQENEQSLRELGSSQAALEGELEVLRGVLEAPERFLDFQPRQMRLNTLNVVVEQGDGQVAADVAFTLAALLGAPKVERAFVLCRLARGDMPAAQLDLVNAERLL